MDSKSHVDVIRERIHGFYSELGLPFPVGANESILLNDGYYCGRRFEYDGLNAIWFIEENEIKYYDRDGTLLHADAMTARQQPTYRRAA